MYRRKNIFSILTTDEIITEGEGEDIEDFMYDKFSPLSLTKRACFRCSFVFIGLFSAICVGVLCLYIFGLEGRFEQTESVVNLLYQLILTSVFNTNIKRNVNNIPAGCYAGVRGPCIPTTQINFQIHPYNQNPI
jgi:hypothetical protein